MQLKEIYIHIGTHKTGTTSLQQFFAINQALLKKKGIRYPLTANMSKVDHRRLVLSFYPNDGLPYCKAIDDVKEPCEEWRTVLESKDEKKILISSEHFFTCTPTIISEIRKITAQYRVWIVCYIRRQDELEESWYNQSVKGFRNSGSLPISEGEYNTRKHFSDWQDIFGTQSLIVRPYEKEQFYQGNIFSDFLHHVFGIELSNDFTLPLKQENTRLHRIALEYQRLINCLPLKERQKDAFNRPLRNVSGKLYESSCRNFSVFSPKTQTRLLKENESFYKELAQKYLPNTNQTFFRNLSVDFQEWSLYQLTSDDACYINAYLSKNHVDLFDILIEGIKTGIVSVNLKEKDAAALLLQGLFDIFKSDRGKLSAIQKSRFWKVFRKLRKTARFFFQTLK